MRQRVRLVARLVVRSPFLFRGLVNARLAVDAAALRDEQGHPLIPGTQLRGVLRMALEKMAKRAPGVVPEGAIRDLFGVASESGGLGGEQDRPSRGRLFFADLVAEVRPASAVTTRVEIDDALGAAKSGALQVVELAAPIGEEVAFSGEVVFDADAIYPAEWLVERMRLALGLVAGIGALKSAGFGEIVEASVRIVESMAASAPVLEFPPSREQVRRCYRLTFDRPFLVDAERLADNMFLGSSVVPGAALKGALAQRLAASGVVDPESDEPWAEALAALRVGHAFPENEHGDCFGWPVPSSVLHGHTGEKPDFGDALVVGLDGVAPGEPAGFAFGTAGDPSPAQFPLDWKDDDFDVFAQAEGFAAGRGPEALPRMHVAIEDDALAAEEHQLFGVVARSHRWLDGAKRGDKRRWRFVVDAEAVDVRCRAALFGLLEAGLGPIGRTDAFAAVERGAEEGPASCEPVGGEHPDLFAVSLKTPALMIDPLAPGTEFARYAEYWRAACGAELVRFFASHRLAGGYLGMRRRLYGATTYYPFLLTEAGAVFLMSKPDVGALSEMLRFGLVPPVFSDGKGGRIVATWRTCPFVPQNGYGEIACNMVDHRGLARGVHHV